ARARATVARAGDLGGVVAEVRAGGGELCDRVRACGRDGDRPRCVVVGGVRLDRRAVDSEVEAARVGGRAELLLHLDRAGRDARVGDSADDIVTDGNGHVQGTCAGGPRYDTAGSAVRPALDHACVVRE